MKMLIFNSNLVIIISILFVESEGLSLNQPNLCRNATWNQVGEIFSTRPITGRAPRGIFINKNNEIYVADRTNHSIKIWKNEQINPTNIIYGNLNSPYSLFVDLNNDIYIDNGAKKTIVKYSFSLDKMIDVINVTDHCLCLFVDSLNNLYYIIEYNHQVMKVSLNDSNTQSEIIAGNINEGSLPNQLSYPHGIYVNINLDLYVADSNNNRIQLFQNGQANGITIIANQSLTYPTSLILDSNHYLFIVDNQNNRIVKYDYNVLTCLFGCNGEGSNQDQLSLPRTIIFDNQANIYVTDQFNDRIVKFSLKTNICDPIATTVSSINQPKFCSNSKWDQNGITFANQSMVGKEVLTIFIDKFNYIYTVDQTNKRIQIWKDNSQNHLKTIPVTITETWAIFVTNNQEIFFGDGNKIEIEKLNNYSNIDQRILTSNGSCTGLFIDHFNQIYYSMDKQHFIRRQSLYLNLPTITIAGTSTSGLTSTQLNNPRGIFVDQNFHLYVADCYNHRIQLFKHGQTNGTTINIYGIYQTITLTFPTDIILDYQGFLFIVDNGNHRIIGQNSHGFRCLVACSKQSGTTNNHLFYPYSMAFDYIGNIYVADQNNHRIQLFLYLNHSCAETSTNYYFDSTQTTTNQLTTLLNQDISHSTGLDQLTTTKNDLSELLTSTKYHQELTTIKNDPSEPLTSTEYHEELTTTKNDPSEPLTSTEYDEELTTTNLELLTSVEDNKLTSIESPLNKQCYLPEVNLIPSRSSASNAKEYEKSEEILISSNIKLNCSLSNSIRTKWKIFVCQKDENRCIYSSKIQSLLWIKSTEIEIESNMLNIGLYKIEFVVEMKDFPLLKKSSITFIRIKSSSIKLNLISHSNSLITIGTKDDLILDPGKYSFNPNEEDFHPSEWIYEYYCRRFNSILTEELILIDHLNNSCFQNKSKNENIFQLDRLNSSLKIFQRSFQPNETYQFLVNIINIRNSSIRAINYLLVHVRQNSIPTIFIDCVIPNQCITKNNLKYLNEQRRISLYSICSDDCSSINSIKWKIYFRSKRDLTWNQFNRTDFLFGLNENNLTIEKEFFENEILNWRFEVDYSLNVDDVSIGAIDIIVNKCPTNGRCQIYPRNGTTNTLFSINCSNWIDEDYIKDYSFFSWTNDQNEEIMFSFTRESTIEVKLSPGDEKTSLINIRVDIRDIFDCVTSFYIDPIYVKTDLNETFEIFPHLNTNEITQRIVSLSQQLNQLSQQDLDQLILQNENLFVSPLQTKYETISSTPLNKSLIADYNCEFNDRALIRDSFIHYLTNSSINTLQNVKLKLSILSLLTKSINELTPTTNMFVADQCYQLSIVLKSLRYQISFQDILYLSRKILQCITNIFTGINGQLQQRINICKTNSTDEDELKTILDIINDEYNEIIDMISEMLNIHSYLNENIEINSNEIYFSLKKLSKESLKNQEIQLIDNTKFIIPNDFHLIGKNLNKFISIRGEMQRIPTFDENEMRISSSRSISLSILNENLDKMSLETDDNNPIEMFIPRDEYFHFPKLILQNVTSNPNHFYSIDLPKEEISFSLNIQISPIDQNLAYLFMYQFHQQHFHGFKLFCPQMLSIDDIYEYFIDNRVLSLHDSIQFGFKELNLDEYEDYCLNNSTLDYNRIVNSPWNFTSNYCLSIYRSACYYFDETTNSWKSDGLWVGPLTNRYETHCYSNHLK